MPNRDGKDTSRHPRRRVDNVVYADFGHPMMYHPAFQARGAEPNTRPNKISDIEFPARPDIYREDKDWANPYGIPRPDLTGIEVKDDD